MEIMSKRVFIPNDFLSASRKILNYYSAPHLHDFFEIEFIISGKGICVIDGCEYLFEPGSVFLLTPLNTHEVRSADAEIFNVMFEVGAQDAISSALSVERLPHTRLTGDDFRLTYELLSEIVRVYEHDIEYARLLLACVLKKLGASENCRIERDGYIKRALLYITESFKGGITLKGVCAHVGLSPCYFSSLFKAELGITFSAYLDNLRFSRAKNLLSFSDMPVSEVCEASGFCDYANFEKRFKHTFGISPKEFRRQRKTKR